MHNRSFPLDAGGPLRGEQAAVLDGCVIRSFLSFLFVIHTIFRFLVSDIFALPFHFYFIFTSLSRLVAFRLPCDFYLAYFAFLTVHTQHAGVFACYLSPIMLVLISFSE
jgi:hypothetical protein